MDEVIDYLGKAMNVKEVSKYLNVDTKTVRKYFKRLGGVRLGRKYVFFERRLIDAIQTPGEMDRTSEEERIPEREEIPDQEGRPCMGIQNEAKAGCKVGGADPHDLFG